MTLTVFDNEGNSDTASLLVIINELPLDTDGDGIFDTKDLDDDNDSFLDEWEEFLSAQRIPAGKIREVKEILEHPHTEKRNILNEIYISSLKQTFKVPGCGFMFEHGGPEVRTEPPLEGADSKTLLQELGYNSSEIDQLSKGSVVGLGLKE